MFLKWQCLFFQKCCTAVICLPFYEAVVRDIGRSWVLDDNGDSIVIAFILASFQRVKKLGNYWSKIVCKISASTRRGIHLDQEPYASINLLSTQIKTRAAIDASLYAGKLLRLGCSTLQCKRIVQGRIILSFLVSIEGKEPFFAQVWFWVW